MDAVRSGPASRHGEGVRTLAMAPPTDMEMGALGPRTSGVCPYSLGARCPLVEIVKRKRRMIGLWNGIWALTGALLSAALVQLVYY